MYLPRVFESPPSITKEVMTSSPFATLVGSAQGEVEIAHVPLLVTEQAGRLLLAGHVARANAFAKLVIEEANVTAVFVSPSAYVSASFYERPSEQVPTWNYAAVHVRGRLRALDDAELALHLTAMAARFEGAQDPWTPSLLTPSFFADLRRAIVGFSIEAIDVKAKAKLSQNRSEADRDRVERALASSEAPDARAVADLMRRARSATPTR